jgi:hypothetical protein
MQSDTQKAFLFTGLGLLAGLGLAKLLEKKKKDINEKTTKTNMDFNSILKTKELISFRCSIQSHLR